MQRDTHNRAAGARRAPGMSWASPWVVSVAVAALLVSVAVAVGALRSPGDSPAASGSGTDPASSVPVTAVVAASAPASEGAGGALYGVTAGATDSTRAVTDTLVDVREHASLTVEVPDVVGMSLDSARVVLDAVRLSLMAQRAAGASTEPDGSLRISSQEPAAGTLVGPEASVAVTLEPKKASAKRSPEKRQGGGWVVCIDPGHQQRGDATPEPLGPGSKKTKPSVTSGTTGVKTTIPEYEIALQISMNLKALLESRGVKVVMTRTTNDVRLSNRERARIATKAGADLFVRIHGDGNPDETVAGISTLYPAKNRWTEKTHVPSKRAASQVQRSVVRSTGALDRGAKARGDLTGFNWSKVPAILVECGFLSNPVEDRLLASPHYQDKVATGIAEGVMAYLKER